MGRKWLVSLCLVFCQAALAENTLIWPTQHPYKDLNPASMFGTETYILGNVYETLFWYDDGEIKPRLATSWEKSGGGRVWTVRLREGVSFHDGTSLDAAAVRKSFEYTRDLGKGAGYLYAGLLSIETPDSQTVVFEFEEPTAFDLRASGQYGSYVIAPAAIDNGDAWMRAGNAIGTGPYVLTKFDPSKLIVISRFDDYWGGWSPGQIDRVIQPTVFEASTRVQMIKSGEADIASVPVGQLKRLRGLPGVSVARSSGWRNNMYFFNTKKYPTDNRVFREALAHLWDHESVLKYIHEGYATRPVGPIPETMWGHGVYEMPSYDPAKALQLLSASGVPEADWKIKAIYSHSNQEQVDAIELFQALAAKVGVEVELSPQTSSRTYMSRVRNPDTAGHMQGMLWYPAYPTPSDWLHTQYRTEPRPLWNLAYYSNPDFDAALDDAIAIEGVDVAASAKAYIAAQDIVMRDTPGIFFADVDRVYAYAAALKGMNTSSNPAYETLFIYSLSK